MGYSSNISVIFPYKTFPVINGGEKYNALLCEYLSDFIPVGIISTKNNVLPAGLKSTFYPLLSNSKWRYLNPFLFFKIRDLVKKNNNTHLCLIHPYFGWLGLLVRRFTHVKLVILSHNIESLRFKSVGKWWWKLLWRYEKAIHSRADINFFITEEDRQYAIAEYRLDPLKCFILTYGIELTKIPTPEERSLAKKKLQESYSIHADEKILFFNGTLNYKPNLDAVDHILNHINPRLMAKKDFKYKIIICGRFLPGEYDDLKKYRSQNIIYAGFVDDISSYFKGVDIFINPVMDGGGIKTKLVEALGYNVSSVSTVNGAFGVSQQVAGNKISIVPNEDWDGFVNAILTSNTEENTGQGFFNHFYWGNIAIKTAQILDQHLLNQ